MKDTTIQENAQPQKHFVVLLGGKEEHWVLIAPDCNTPYIVLNSQADVDTRNYKARVGKLRTLEEARQAYQAEQQRIARETPPPHQPTEALDKAAEAYGNVASPKQFPKNGQLSTADLLTQTITDEAERRRNGISQWQTPTPIETGLLSVLSVRYPMLPDKLRPWLIDVSNRMKCPLDFVASATIVMVSSLIGTRLTIKPKAKDDWAITPNLWGAVIGDPSAMKTPSVNEVLKPLNRLITQKRKEYEEERQRYEAEQVSYDAQKKVFASQEQDRIKGKTVGNPVEYPEQPHKPTERRFMTNDATVEKMADLLNENPTGVLQFRDELTGLLAGWERQGREEDRAFYLEAWNGTGSKTVDRIGRGTIHVETLCVSLFGGIQPVKLLGYLRAATSYDNDGFVQRLQVAVYPDKPTWAYVDDYPDKEARDQAFALIEQIVTADFSGIAYSVDEYNRYPYTRFDAEGQAVFVEWITHWEQVVLPSESGLLLEHFTKYRSLMPSLALIFHVINCMGDTSTATDEKRLVTADAARMAVQWCEYLQSHARRIYGLLDTQQEEAARTLLKHLKAGHLQDGFKVRDVVRKGWTGLDKTQLAESALSELVERHWLKEVEPGAPTNGRPETPHYLIHPQIIQKT